MRIGIFGTGPVGKAIGSRLVEVGHQVCMGSRTTDNGSATEWSAAAGELATHGTFADAAAFGELLVNATMGLGSLDAFGSVASDDLEGKVLLDISNPLDFSPGSPRRSRSKAPTASPRPSSAPSPGCRS